MCTIDIKKGNRVKELLRFIKRLPKPEHAEKHTNYFIKTIELAKLDKTQLETLYKKIDIFVSIHQKVQLWISDELNKG